MNSLKRILSAKLGALLFLTIIGVTQASEDEDYYYLKKDVATQARTSAANYLPVLRSQRDQIEEILTSYESSLSQINQRITSDQNAASDARNRKNSATESLEYAQYRINLIDSQLPTQQALVASIQSSLSDISAQIDESEATIIDLQDQWNYWDPSDQTGLNALQEQINSQNAQKNYLLSLASNLQAQFAQAEDDLGSLASERDADAVTVANSQNEINVAQNDLEWAAAYRAFDEQERSTFIGYRNQAQSTLTGAETEISAQEGLFDDCDSWLNTNPSYNTWVSNGRPEE